MTTVSESSDYINATRLAYSTYVMQHRALPAITDGMKASLRRVMWIARDGKKIKSATLAGLAMAIHPHQAPEGAVNTLASHYGNNIPLLYGYSAFGTLTQPTQYTASRYTSVSASEFAKDAFYTDVEILPMQETYDSAELEPVHFLPLVPMAILNPSDGIAIGFASTILPRCLKDLIEVQIAHLTGKKTTNQVLPVSYPIGSAASLDTKRPNSYLFSGTLNVISTSALTVTGLPYGIVHAKFIEILDSLMEAGVIVNYDDATKDTINITVKFKRGTLKDQTTDELLNLLKLNICVKENLNVLDFSGNVPIAPDPVELIQKFTDWRLKWYVPRYERLRDMIMQDLQKFYDIRIAIKSNVGGVARKLETRAELKELLTGLKIVNVDYIADLPTYRYTQAEFEKNEERIREGEKTLEEYNRLLADENARKAKYVEELSTVLRKFTKGQYK